MIPTSFNSPYGATTSGTGGIDDFLAKYQINTPQTNVNNVQPTPSPISELDEYLAGLPSDKRNAVEVSPEYQSRKLRLFDKFLTYAIAMTPDGNSFLGTTAGRKLAQDLLDSAQKIANNFESESRNELEQMKNLINQQSSQIEKLQNELNEQKLIYDFSKCEASQQKKKEPTIIQKTSTTNSNPPAIVLNNNGGNQ